MRAVEAPGSYLIMTDESKNSICEEKNSDAAISIEELLAYQETVFRICLGYSRNYAEAEDLAQEVYLRACQSLPSLRNPSLAKEWLFRITKNVCLDHQKKARGRGILLRRWVKESVSTPDPAVAENPDERLRQLKSAIRGLPQRLRVVFILREYGHLTYEELAATLRLHKGTVMSRLNRARRRIAAALGEKSHE